MSIEQTLGSLFKAEVKSSGRKLLSEEKVFLSIKSDTAIEATIRVSPPLKVKLASKDISHPIFTISCSCPAAKKNRLCKHSWATLLCTESEFPDFLSNKTEIELLALSGDGETKQKAYQETAKTRASEYRKAQYQKSKQLSKDKKDALKGKSNTRSSKNYSAEVEASLSYFSDNGFPMPDGPSEEIVADAKKKLSRFFHPDRGGTHEESAELNQHCDVILHFFRR